MKLNDKLLGSLYLVLGVLFSYVCYFKTWIKETILITIGLTIFVLLILFSGFDRLVGRVDKNFYERLSKRGKIIDAFVVCFA